MRILYDDQRHLIAVPYSLENLHRAAEQLGIKRCWFHKDHYDIPKRMVADVGDGGRKSFAARDFENCSRQVKSLR